MSLDEFSQDSEQTTTCRKQSVWFGVTWWRGSPACAAWCRANDEDSTTRSRAGQAHARAGLEGPGAAPGDVRRSTPDGRQPGRRRSEVERRRAEVRGGFPRRSAGRHHDRIDRIDRRSRPGRRRIKGASREAASDRPSRLRRVAGWRPRHAPGHREGRETRYNVQGTITRPRAARMGTSRFCISTTQRTFSSKESAADGDLATGRLDDLDQVGGSASRQVGRPDCGCPAAGSRLS